MDAVAPRTITSSTNASPIVVTFNGHGLVTGDKITIFGHETNTAANGTWTVTKVTDNTFSLDGSTGNGVGGNTGCFAKQANIALCEDFDAAVLSISTDGGGDAAMTVKVVASDSEDIPDFAGTQAPDNHYDYVEVIDLEDGSAIDGDTGFVVATADNTVRYEANTSGQKWITVIPTAGTEGEVTITARLFNY